MIINKTEFCEKIELNYAYAPDNEKSIIASILSVCDEHDVEYEMVKPLLNRAIIEKVECEAHAMNMLKKKKESKSLDDFFA